MTAWLRWMTVLHFQSMPLYSLTNLVELFKGHKWSLRIYRLPPKKWKWWPTSFFLQSGAGSCTWMKRSSAQNIFVTKLGQIYNSLQMHSCIPVTVECPFLTIVCAFCTLIYIFWGPRPFLSALCIQQRSRIRNKEIILMVEALFPFQLNVETFQMCTYSRNSFLRYVILCNKYEKQFDTFFHAKVFLNLWFLHVFKRYKPLQQTWAYHCHLYHFKQEWK